MMAVSLRLTETGNTQMTRSQKTFLLWNGVIYGFSFATALVVAALLRPAHELPKTIENLAALDAPAAATSPVGSVAEVVVP